MHLKHKRCSLVLGLSEKKRGEKIKSQCLFWYLHVFYWPLGLLLTLLSIIQKNYVKPFYGGRNRYWCSLQVSENIPTTKRRVKNELSITGDRQCDTEITMLFTSYYPVFLGITIISAAPKSNLFCTRHSPDHPMNMILISLCSYLISKAMEVWDWNCSCFSVMNGKVQQG